MIEAEWTRESAREFASRWLPAWTGNDPELLAGFYTDDAFYLDAGVPDGVQGRSALLAYFRTLLGHNPDWVWTQRDAVPICRNEVYFDRAPLLAAIRRARSL